MLKMMVFLIMVVSIILGWFCITSSRPTSIWSKGLVTCDPLGINKMRGVFGCDSSSPSWTFCSSISTLSRFFFSVDGSSVSSMSLLSSSLSSYSSPSYGITVGAVFGF